MSHIEITPEVWTVEKHIAEQSLASTGRLPTGDARGGKFWDMVRSHYLYDIATTGNDRRFIANHCPFVDRVETDTPIVPPVILPIACIPTAPPVISTTPSSPEIPTVGSPVAPPIGSDIGSAVPEPASMVLMSVPIFFAGLVFLMRMRWAH